MSEAVAEALHLTVIEVTIGIGPRGFSKKFLEEKSRALEKEGKWLPSSVVLDLLIYGVIMFPNDDDFINPSTINIFLSKNPVTALLADVYYCLHTRHEKKKGVVLSCAPMLYSWLLSHRPQKGPWVEFLKDLKWSQKLASLTSNAIVWYLPAWKVEKVVTSCGEFSNVPLMGPRGCINYNPSLVLRHIWYPLETKPKT